MILAAITIDALYNLLWGICIGIAPWAAGAYHASTYCLPRIIWSDQLYRGGLFASTAPAWKYTFYTLILVGAGVYIGRLFWPEESATQMGFLLTGGIAFLYCASEASKRKINRLSEPQYMDFLESNRYYLDEKKTDLFMEEVPQ